MSGGEQTRGAAARAWWALAAFAARQMFRQKRLVLAAILLAMPALIGVLVRALDPHITPTHLMQFFWSVALFLVLSGTVPLVAMLFCTTLIREEAAEGTLTYLFTRRLSRPAVLLAKFAGTVVTLIVLNGLAQLALYAVCAWGVELPEGPAWPGRLGLGLGLTAMGTVVFAALFTFLGVIVRRPLGAGVMYLLVCEWIIANIPLNIRQFSVNYYLRCVLHGTAENLPRVGGWFKEDLTGVGRSLITLAVIAVTAVVIAVLIVRRTEYSQAGEAGR